VLTHPSRHLIQKHSSSSITVLRYLSTSPMFTSNVKCTLQPVYILLQACYWLLLTGLALAFLFLIVIYACVLDLSFEDIPSCDRRWDNVSRGVGSKSDIGSWDLMRRGEVCVIHYCIQLVSNITCKLSVTCCSIRWTWVGHVVTVLCDGWTSDGCGWQLVSNVSGMIDAGHSTLLFCHCATTNLACPLTQSCRLMLPKFI